MKIFLLSVSLLMFFVATHAAPHKPVARHAIDSSFYQQLAERKQWTTAVIIIGYNRPHYFKEVLAALESNPESNTLPFFFILDGGPQARQRDYERLIKASNIKHRYIIKRTFNYGLHRNIIDGLRFIFDHCRFERIIHFEDDVVVTPEYLRLVLNLDDWAHTQYGNIGAVQAFRPCAGMTLAEKNEQLDVVGETAGLLLGYVLRKSVWDSIKDIPYEYENNFLFSTRQDPQARKAWMYRKLNAKPFTKSITPPQKRWQVPLDPYYSKIPEMGTGQCGVLTMSFFLRGYYRLTTLVNRAITIGKKGTYYNPKLFEFHFGGATLDRFEQDQHLEVFEPHDRFVY